MATKRISSIFSSSHGRRHRMARRAVVESLESRQMLAVVGSPADQLAPAANGYLDELYSDWLAHVASGSTTAFSETQPTIYQFQNDAIGVQIYAPEHTDQVAEAVEEAGLIAATPYDQHIGGWAPMDSLPAITGVAGVEYVSLSFAPIYNAGSVQTQGDAALGSNEVRGTLGFDGTGVSVGVISDSCDTGPSAIDEADDIASEDLPGLVCPALENGIGDDEGRAMLQIIHDVAPGADLSFRDPTGADPSDVRATGDSPPPDQAGMAAAITSLSDQNVDVIVDDVTFLNEPFFEDSFVAQRIEAVTSRAVDPITYVTSAGNNGDNSYESNFRDSSVSPGAQVGSSSGGIGTWHNFDDSGGVSLMQEITIPFGTEIAIVFQHADPFRSLGGSGQTNDFAVVFAPPTFDPTQGDANPGGTVFRQSNSALLFEDPVEIIKFENTDPANDTYQFGIIKLQGSTDPLAMKYVVNHLSGDERASIPAMKSNGTANFDTNSSTVVGHASAPGAIAVGAAFYLNTPAFDIDVPPDPPRVSDYSGRGVVSVVGPDGVNTTHFGQDIPEDADTDPNFFGTSAAAAHVAGVVALMLQADASQTPAENRAILESTAIDIVERVDIVTDTTVPGAAVGNDAYSGFGFVDALAAVQQSVGIPTVDLNTGTPGLDNNATFNENPGTPVSIAGPVDIVDPDDTNLASATVTITDLADDPNEIIGFDVSGTNITGAYTAATGILTLSGIDTVENYEQVLNTLTYELNSNMPTGTSRTIEVEISDGANSSTSTINLTIVPFNDPPIASADGPFTTDEDMLLTVDEPGVLGNDSDPEGDSLEAVLMDNVSNGTLTLNADGSFTYDPNPNYNGTDSFTYSANDGSDNSAPVTVTIMVNAVNDPPVANDETFSTNEDMVLTIAAAGVLTNDTDIEDNPLTAVLQNDVTNGTLALNEDGSFSYTPDTNYFGPDSFTYFANDGSTNSTTAATVTINVAPVNDPPVAVDDSYSVGEDMTLTINAPGFLGNDTDVEDDPLTAVLFTDVANGTLARNSDGSFTYTPNANFAGTDSFSYFANDGFANSLGSATVTITVNQINDRPVAVDDSFSTDEDTTLTINAPGLLGNDTDVENDSLTAIIDTDVTDGTLTLNNDGSFSYTPDADFFGTDSFTYFANDGQNSATAATVTLTVNAVNDAPVASNDSFTTVEDTPLNISTLGVLANDTDTEDDDLSAVIVSTTTNGNLTLNADGSFDYTPNANFQGTDTFTYRANDGTVNSANIATVTITVTEENDPPVAGNDSFTTPEDMALTISAPGVLGNDTDTENDTLTALLGTDVSNGSLALNSDGSFTYTPNPDFFGTDSFTYFARDGVANSNEATVMITVAAINDAPVATGESFATNEDTPLTINAPGVLSNDTDVENDTLSAVVVNSTSNGTLSLSSDGSFIYTPNLNFNGSDSFSYLANDGNADSNEVTVSLTINAVNDAPVFTSSPVTTAQENNSYSYSITTNDVDNLGTALTITAPTLPNWLSFVDNGDGTASLTGTPLFADIGLHTVQLTVTDPGNASSPQSFTIEVFPDNVPPTAGNDNFTIDEDDTNVTLDVLANDTTAPDTGETITIIGLSGVGLGHDVQIVGAPGSQTLLYTPPANFFGTETFSYTINDGSDPDSNDTAIVTVMVNEINDPPTANDDTFFGIMEDSIDNVFDVLANDTFAPDINETLTITNISTPDSGGTAVLDDGGTADPSDDVILYSPAPGFRGTETFIYTIDDGRNGTDTATVNVAVFNQPVFQVASTGDVFAIGSDGSDRIIFFPTNSSLSISVRYNNRFFGPFFLQPDSTLNADGRGGSDAIIVAGTTDVTANFEGGTGNDYLAGNIADDNLSGGPGNDTMLAGEGDNFMEGGDGNDRLEGRSGSDRILGGLGNDRINGSGGNDVLYGGDGNDAINGGDGDDLIFGEGGSDNLNGGIGNDLIVGGDEADSLFGRQGNDVLIGGLGADRLRGSTEDDLLLGGASAYDDNEAALQAILAEWAGGSGFATKIANISSGSTTGGNPLSISTGSIDDSQFDDLTGDGGQDWFLAFTDFVRDERAGDQVDR